MTKLEFVQLKEALTTISHMIVSDKALCKIHTAKIFGKLLAHVFITTIGTPNETHATEFLDVCTKPLRDTLEKLE